MARRLQNSQNQTVRTINDELRAYWLIILASAAAVAFIGFLFVDSYSPHMGLLWNLMNAEITLPLCPGCKTLRVEFGYRWVLALCFAAAVYALYLRTTK